MAEARLKTHSGIDPETQLDQEALDQKLAHYFKYPTLRELTPDGILSLLEQKANPRTINEPSLVYRGETYSPDSYPLIELADRNSHTLIQKMLEAKADPRLRHINKSFALFKATSATSADCVQVLIEAAPELINDKDEFGDTPLLNALATLLKPQPKIISILLDNKADPTIRDAKGNTALHRLLLRFKRSIKNPLFEIFSRLIQYPDIINAKNSVGESPLDMIRKLTIENLKDPVWTFPEVTTEQRKHHETIELDRLRLQLRILEMADHALCQKAAKSKISRIQIESLLKDNPRACLIKEDFNLTPLENDGSSKRCIVC